MHHNQQLLEETKDNCTFPLYENSIMQRDTDYAQKKLFEDAGDNISLDWKSFVEEQHEQEQSYDLEMFDHHDQTLDFLVHQGDKLKPEHVL